jgi:head-tail adaptor
MIQAGRLDRRVTLLRPGATVDDGYSAAPGPPEVAGRRWASVRAARGGEGFESAQREGRRLLSFWLRWDRLTATIDASWEIEHDGRRHQVTGVSEIGRREGVELLAVAAENEGATA